MSYPASLDSFTSPTANQTLNSPSHSTIETAQNTALAAVETKLGVDGSAVATTIDYLVKNTSSVDPGHKHSLSTLSDFSVTSPANNDLLQYNGTKWANKAASSVSMKFGGTGSDGALNISSGTTSLDLGGKVIFIKNYSSISITNTGKLAFTNAHANGTIIVLKSKGDVTLSSSTSIDASGMGAASTNKGTTNTATIFTNPGATGTHGASAASGGAALSSVDITANGFYKEPILCCGSGGGQGSNATTSGDSISGGAGGGTFINTGSNGGTTNGTGTASGLTPISNGGAGGAALMIECAGTYNNTSSTITVAGKAGDTSVTTNISSGGGGAGGTLVILYNALGSDSGTYTLAGGNGGTGGTNKGAGGNGATGFKYIGSNTEYA